MFEIENFLNNDDIRLKEESGPFKVVEYKRDLSVMPAQAQTEWFSSQLGIRRHQVVCELNQQSVTVQAGAMQWMLGNITQKTDVGGVMDFARKIGKSLVTKENVVNSSFAGTGILALEPTYKHILLEDLRDWEGSVVMEDGMFLACSGTAKQKVVQRTNLSSTVAGGEGLFNLCIFGEGIVCLESPVPREELVSITLKDDVLKVDGSLAVAWSASLNFNVTSSSKSLIASATTGEGLVNEFRGTGKVLLCPVSKTR